MSNDISKLFTRILFNRLEKYLENNNIICPEQIGFKRGARTSDHIFWVIPFANLMENETSLYMSSIIFKKCPMILHMFSLSKSACLLTVSKAFKILDNLKLLCDKWNLKVNIQKNKSYDF
jgi:hypothetical protein